MFDSANCQWSNLYLSVEDEGLMKRTNFGACRANFNTLFICGGMQKVNDESQLETLSVFSLVKVTIVETQTGYHAMVDKIQIFSEIDNLVLSSFSLKMRKNTLFICGGNTGDKIKELKNSFKKNHDLILIDHSNNSSKIVSPPDLLKGNFIFNIKKI